jgi:hypothetical protein
MIRYDVYQADRCIAQCTSWDAKQAALRLLVGTSLVLPPNIQIREISNGSSR